MQLFGPSFLLLEYLAFSDSKLWTFDHPDTVYSWEGACVWIPCLYKILEGTGSLDNLTVYHNYEYDSNIKDFTGTILYKTQKVPLRSERVQFLGNNKDNCSLFIQPVHVKDSGQLGLRMVSGDKKWMENVNLNVSERPPPPHIQLPLEIRESQEVALTCWLNFTCPQYPIQLQWSLDNSAVNSTSLSTKTVSVESKLTFCPQWADHGKNLSCRLENSVTKEVLSQKTVWLDVKHLPKLEIEVSPREAIVTEGASVTMTCRIISSNPEYQTIFWFKDSTRLQKQKTATLTLSKVTKEESGKYHCQVLNAMGSRDSKDVFLQVQFAPEPSSVKIDPLPAKEGNTVQLTCISQANPSPTNYTWYHNGKVLGRTEKNFQIPNILLQHAGNYSCLAENSLGTGQIGLEAELDVQYPPKGVTMMIQSPTPVREGDNVILVCNYNSSNPRVTKYQWKSQFYRNESFSEVLMIQKVTWNASPITCLACNLWCSQSPSITLNVQYAPKDVRVLKVSPSTEIHSGQQVLLQCDFSSSHPTNVSFFWKKNGSLLEEGKELRFDSISPEDAGNYNCLVKNSIGQTTSETWMLQVLYAPRQLRVSIAPKDSVMEGKKAVLTCESDANPPVSQYAWFDWNNQNLHNAAQTLRLEPAKVQHSGAYRCQGANQLGTGQSPPSTLTVYYSPETVGKRAAVGIGACLSILILAIWGFKLQRGWKKIQAQQELQENSSGQSFFVRNKKVRRARFSEVPHSLGCYNPAMEDSISYAALRFPVDETDTSGTGDAGTSDSIPNREDMVTYSVVQKHRVGDYENVAPGFPEDEGLHYSELVHFGAGERPPTREEVEYVTLKP